ncbi:transposase, partial [Leptospira weilii]|uniref:transposase n=1 Tax=Leptospira weilii TaxID=28184 RepID=UPI0012DA4505
MEATFELKFRSFRYSRKRLHPLLPKIKTNRLKGGRPRVEDRKVMAAIFYRVRTGVQWRYIPSMFGSK